MEWLENGTTKSEWDKKEELAKKNELAQKEIDALIDPKLKEIAKIYLEKHKNPAVALSEVKAQIEIDKLVKDPELKIKYDELSKKISRPYVLLSSLKKHLILINYKKKYPKLSEKEEEAKKLADEKEEAEFEAELDKAQ